MNDLVAFIKSKYIEELVSPINLHTATIFLVSLCALRLVPQKACIANSLWLLIAYLRPSDIINPQSRLWVDLVVLDIVIAILITTASNIIYSQLKQKTFQILSSIKDINDYVDKLKTRIFDNLTGNLAVDLLLVKDVSKNLPDVQKKLIRLHSFGELSVASFFISVISIIRGKVNTLDSLLISASVFLLFFFQWRAYLFYLERVVPVELPEKLLRDGKFTPESS